MLLSGARLHFDVSEWCQNLNGRVAVPYLYISTISRPSYTLPMASVSFIYKAEYVNNRVREEFELYVGGQESESGSNYSYV